MHHFATLCGAKIVEESGLRWRRIPTKHPHWVLWLLWNRWVSICCWWSEIRNWRVLSENTLNRQLSLVTLRLFPLSIEASHFLGTQILTWAVCEALLVDDWFSMVIQLDDTPRMECLARSKLAILAMSSSWSSRFADLVVDSNGGEPGEPSKMNCFSWKMT